METNNLLVGDQVGGSYMQNLVQSPVERNRPSSNRKGLILFSVILLLILGNIFWGIKYITQFQETKIIQKELASKNTNYEVINFLKLFIEKVLRTNKEVSFENRLILEESIINIGDGEILSAWEKFTEAETEFEIQEGVKDLLEVLAKKANY